MTEKVELKDRLKTALNIREKKAADLVRDLRIPKSAVSQYLSGKSQNMDSKRLYAICNYLDVSIPWMMGFDVPMKTKTEKENDIISDVVVRMRTDEVFLSVVKTLNEMDSTKLSSLLALLE